MRPLPLRISLAVLLTTGCVDPDDVEDLPGEVTPLTGDRAGPDLYGVFELGNTWHKDAFTVCWLADVFDDPVADHQTLRMRGEAAVMREWARVGRVRFNAPWPRCAPDSRFDIRIGNQTTSGTLGQSTVGTDAILVPSGHQTMGLLFRISVPGCARGNLPCDRSTVAAVSDRDIASFEHTILHEFGHALGLRHEHAHEESTCHETEALDQPPFVDGQSIFAYDATSVMDHCSSATKLSDGDVRSLHTLYPGVVGLYPNFDFGVDGVAPPLFVGPGSFSGGALPTISSIVVPPGYTARVCTATVCATTGTTRALPAPFNDGIQSLLVVATVVGFDRFGFQGASESFTSSRNAPFTVLGDNQMSSVFPAPTTAARVCTGVSGTGTCSSTFTGGTQPFGYQIHPAINYDASYIEVSRRVVTYSGTFHGTSNALALGVYTASGNAPFLPDVRTLAMSGLHAFACTQEGPQGTGAGDCRTYTQSAELGSHGPIRYLQVKTPPPRER